MWYGPAQQQRSPAQPQAKSTAQSDLTVGDSSTSDAVQPTTHDSWRITLLLPPIAEVLILLVLARRAGRPNGRQAVSQCQSHSHTAHRQTDSSQEERECHLACSSSEYPHKPGASLSAVQALLRRVCQMSQTINDGYISRSHLAH